MMLQLATQAYLARTRLHEWIRKERRRLTDDKGLSQTIETILLAIFVIAIVGAVIAIIQAFILAKAAEIR